LQGVTEKLLTVVLRLATSLIDVAILSICYYAESTRSR
jgi:hypothetical protein